MATVPNYYYNSPWIADAGRNLASALAPPDPKEILAREQGQWQFQRMQQLAREAEEDRTANLEADKALAELSTDEEAVNPVTGVVDQRQTGINRRNIAARAFAGGREYVEPTNKLLGQYSSTFETEQLLKVLGIAASESAQNRRFGNQMDLARFQAGEQEKRDQNRFANNWSMQQYRTSAQFALHNARAQQRLLEIQERAKTESGNPKNISGKMLEDIVTFLDTRVAESGAQLPAGAYNELLTRMAINASRHGDVPLAVADEWEKAGLDAGDMGAPAAAPGPIAQLFQSLGFGSSPQYLTPNFGPRPGAPTQDTGSAYERELKASGGEFQPAVAPPLPPGVPTLGGVITAPEAAGPPIELPAAPSPAPAPARAAPKSGAPPARLLKEGIETTFKGKGTWTLKKGVPTRVK